GLAPRGGDLPQLRVEGHRRRPGADAAAAGARARALAFARRACGARVARPAGAGVRLGRDRDLPGAVRAAAGARARRARAPALVAAARDAAVPLPAPWRAGSRVAGRRPAPGRT